MALIVEDGTGIENANTYNSEADAVTYFGDRGIPLVGPTYAGSLLLAMDIFGHLKFRGTKANSINDLQFARDDITDIYGDLYAENVIPQEVRKAQLWLAHYIDNGSNPGAVATPQIKRTREKVETIDEEVEYAISAATKISVITIQDLPHVYKLIQHLIDTSTVTINSGGVYR